LGAQKQEIKGFLRILFFSCFFWRNFHWNIVLEGVSGIPVFTAFTGIFCRKSCGTGISAFTADSSGFL
jgi:hypothetical protein